VVVHCHQKLGAYGCSPFPLPREANLARYPASVVVHFFLEERGSTLLVYYLGVVCFSGNIVGPNYGIMIVKSSKGTKWRKEKVKRSAEMWALSVLLRARNRLRPFLAHDCLSLLTGGFQRRRSTRAKKGGPAMTV